MHDLTISSIINARNTQHAKFILVNNVTDSSNNFILTELSSSTDIETYIKNCKKALEITGDLATYSYHINDPIASSKRWIERNNLFHAILMFIQIDSRINYKLGNFGSTNPTSDIDACIQFDGNPKYNNVSDVIEKIEDAYVKLVGIPCLKLDIEFYDSYISSSEGTEQKYKVDFTTNDEENQLKELLPYALASMMRNIHIVALPDVYARALKIVINQNRRDAMIDSIPGIGLSNNKKISEMINDIILGLNIQESQTNSSQTDSSQTDSSTPVIINEFTIPDICNSILLTVFEKLKSKKLFDKLLTTLKKDKPGQLDESEKLAESEKLDESEKEVHDTSEGNVTVDSAKKLYRDYFDLKTYDERRTKYYEKLKEVELMLKTSNNSTDIDFLKALCASQLYRQEGYICISTVLHVPRFMQACKDKDGKDGCKTTCSNDDTKLTNPACLQNVNTYLLSMIEQLGFIVRFYIEADGDIDDGHYQTKLKKYLERWNDAKSKIDELLPSSKTIGGSRIRKTTMRRKVRRTRKTPKHRKVRRTRKATKRIIYFEKK